jgi:3'(2'), 5'-bisphosphate nucleotidase
VIAEEDAAALRANDDVLAEVVRRVQAVRPEAGADDVCAWIDRGNAEAYSDRFWTLDPIDGTKGFVRGDQYAIALALVVDGVVQVAALGCPNLEDALDDPQTTGQILSAVRGEGAVQLPLSGPAGEATAIHASTLDDLSGARFTDSFVSAHSSHDWAQAVADHLGMTEPPVRIDSQAKYALVARGDAEIYFRLPRPGGNYTEKIWDHAAGMLLVEVAGGTVTDIHGKPLDFTHGYLLEANEGIVATNGEAHDDVLAALDAVRAEG